MRIKRQNSRRISVIIGNPPYNANQLNENENNKNREYPEIDKRIKETYIAESTARRPSVYDMYARFFRWAADRLDENGILAFITNRSFIDSRTFDGFREAASAKEFNEIRIVDLGGDVRSKPEAFRAPSTMSSASRPVWRSALWSSGRSRRAAGSFTRGGRRLETADEKQLVFWPQPN